MAALTREEILAALGPVEDIIVSDILASGASAEEFAQARAWLVNDEAPINAGDPLASGRIAQVMEILETLEPAADEPTI